MQDAERSDLWQRLRDGYALPALDRRPGAEVGAVVRQSSRLRAAHDRARQPLPLLHRRRGRTARHARRAGLAALHRERLQPAGRLERTGVRHVAVHARHRQGLRSAPEPVPRRPARRAGLDTRRARLSAAPARPVRRLAPCAGGLQLGPGQRAAGHRSQPPRRPGGRLRQPAHARRDAQLRAQAAGGDEHRGQARDLRLVAAAAGKSPLLPRAC